MIEHLHYFGSRLRRSRALRPYDAVWQRLSPAWQRVHGLLARRGLPTQINQDVFRLSNEIGSRYGRHAPREYEAVFYGAFADVIRPGMTVFDIGAHVGLFTLAAAKRIGSGRVYAFEPTEASAEAIATHLALNRWQDRAEVVRAVVSDRDGTRSFFTSGTTTAASIARENLESPLNREVLNTPVREVVMPAITIDSFATRIGRSPDVIKIDAEGAEALVLAGARDVLATGRSVILCEVHPQQMRHCGSSMTQLQEIVTAAGYRMDALDAPNDAGAFHVRIARQ